MAPTIVTNTLALTFGAETSFGSVGGGPFDFLDAYVDMSGVAAAIIPEWRIYATAGGVQSLVARGKAGGKACVVAWDIGAEGQSSTQGQPGFGTQQTAPRSPVRAIGTAYELRAFVDKPAGYVGPAPSAAAALVGYNESDVVADQETSASVAIPSNFAEVTIATLTGFMQSLDVAVGITEDAPVLFTLYAVCGNVTAPIAQQVVAQMGSSQRLFSPTNLPGATAFVLKAKLLASVQGVQATASMAGHSQSSGLVPNPNTWTQAFWFIDPVNGNDSNDGKTAATAVKSYNGGVVARWGTTSPTLPQTTTLTWLTSQPNGAADPVILEPVMVNGVCIIEGILGVAQQLSAGAIAAVTARVFNPPQLLEVTLPGPALPAGTLIRNTTALKDSFAFVNTAPGGGVYTMEQPLTPTVLPYGGSVFAPTEVNNWLALDTFVAYEPCHVNLVRFEPIAAQFLAPDFPTPGQVANIVIMSADGIPGDNIVSLSDGVTLVNVRSDCQVAVDSVYHYDNAGTCAWIGCDISQGVLVPSQTLLALFGGKIADQVFAEAVITCAAMLDTLFVQSGGGAGITVYGSASFRAQLTSVYVEGTVVMQEVSFIGLAVAWGPGTLNFTNTSRNLYGVGGRTAVNTFVNTGGLLMNGQANANPWKASTATWEPAIALNPANLDAAFGPAGFGGVAINPGGASLVAGQLP
jgi:hypothetical protein